jgi:hypothetical protein
MAVWDAPNMLVNVRLNREIKDSQPIKSIGLAVPAF